MTQPAEITGRVPVEFTACHCAPPGHAWGISRCVHSRRSRVTQAIRDRLDDLGTETRDQEGNPDGGLWLDGLDAVADDLASVVLDALTEEPA